MQHQKQLENWIHKFKSPIIETAEIQDAIFEICRMGEEEIFLKLSAFVVEGTEYFLIDKYLHNNLTQNEFYFAMTTAFGRMENPKAGLVLITQLERMTEVISSYSQKSASPLEIRYMITLSEALANSKAIGFFERFQKIRTQMASYEKFYASAMLVAKKLYQNEELLVDTSDLAGFFRRGIARKKVGDIQGAIDDFSHIIQQQPSKEAYLERAILFYNAKSYAEALADFEELFKTKIHSVEAYLYRGLSYFQISRYQEALDNFNVAIEKDPQCIEAYYHRATIYQHQFLPKEPDKKQFYAEKAAKDYEVVLELLPSQPEKYGAMGSSFNFLIDCKLILNDFSNAIELVNAMIRQAPNQPNFYAQRGMIKQRMKDYQGAVEDMNIYIALKPNDLGLSYYNRGFLLYEMGDYKKALVDFQNSVVYRPHFDLAFYRQAELYLVLKNQEEARKAYQQAVESSFRLYENYEKENRFGGMRIALNTILQFAPKNHPRYQEAEHLLRALEKKLSNKK